MNIEKCVIQCFKTVLRFLRTLENMSMFKL